jgi:puromycin-sensitive aminopeptidase
MEPKAHRLPSHVRPVGYAVDISTYPARADFEGTLEATLEVKAHSKTIEMHARDLEVRDARVTVGAHTFHADVAPNPETETVVFSVDKPLQPGRIKLTLHFRGHPNTSMHGLYLAQDGLERAICTQCEATDARAIFPCFDEPEFKATISWRIRTEGNVIALSNCPLIGVEAEGTHKIWRFETSAPISSYLFALVVGDLEGTQASSVGVTPSRVWAMRGKIDQAHFAHDFTLRLMPWYERYFDHPYPFKKYDQIAVPGFDAGAMENVGLVLFRQNLLLMDPRAASWNQEKLIAKVIAHELAHMWFGNLVTMKWWDDLWLNEAFAEWMAHKATHAIEPSYLVWNDFQADKNRALVDDALPTTHSIWAPVKTPSEAIEMFDVITYQKGCAVMRMLENFLGEQRFMAGLRTYMKAFAFSNAAGGDLWRQLETASGQPVGALMRSWVEQPGFPIITFSTEESGPGGPTALRLEQRRFYSSPKASTEASGQRWSVPIVVRFEDDTAIKEHRFILDEREAREELPAQGAVKWVCANADEIGFYRANPVGTALDAILAHGPQKLTAVEQMGFVEDQWALVRNATSTITRFIPVLEAFSVTRDHNVLRAITDRLATIELLLKDANDPKARQGFRKWVADTFTAQLDELGFEPHRRESQNDMQRRALIIFALASLARVEGVIEECVRYAAEEQKDPRSVDPNLSGTFVSIAAKFGDERRYDTWLETYRARKLAGAPPQDCLRYLYTLAAFRPEPLTKRTLAYIEDGSIPQEAVGSIMGQLLSTREGQELAWAYLKSSWETLRTRVGDMGLSRVVEAVGALKASHREDIVAFFREHSPKGAERALARALEGLDQREELRQRVTPSLVQRFMSS